MIRSAALEHLLCEPRLKYIQHMFMTSGNLNKFRPICFSHQFEIKGMWGNWSYAEASTLLLLASNFFAVLAAALSLFAFHLDTMLPGLALANKMLARPQTQHRSKIPAGPSHLTHDTHT